MTENVEIYRLAGEAIELSQMLEESLTIPIMMLSILKLGGQKEYSKVDVANVFDRVPRKQVLKNSKKINERFIQDVKIEVGQILLLVQKGSMGDLKKTLEERLKISPGGPNAFFVVLERALKARNYLCHSFFKDYIAGATQSWPNSDPVSKLEEISSELQEAIQFSHSLELELRGKFPKTFLENGATLH